jgi:hypothetical protein
MSRHVTRMFCAVAAGFALTASGLATACAASTGAASTAGPSLAGRTAQSAITCCSLSGVAATSDGNAWAVGRGGPGPRTAILHWNGTAWTRVPSPGRAYSSVAGVAATSAHTAWAVGATDSGNTLILHWNGTSWEQERSPNPIPGHGEYLIGVAATSARNAWAAGYAGGGQQALIVHWNGVSWSTMT